MRLPDEVPHCRPPAHVSVAGWELLALDQVNGAMPGFPWTSEHQRAAYVSCLALTHVRDPDRFTDRQWGAHFHRDDSHGVDLQAIRDGTYHRPAEHGVDP